MENEDIETISSLEQLKKVMNQWTVWDLTPSGLLTMQSIYGDLFDFQLDMSNRELFIKAVLYYEEDKNMEWRA